MRVFILNCGSSSLKCAVIQTKPERQELVGTFERLGTDQPTGSITIENSQQATTFHLHPGATHAAALKTLIEFLQTQHTLAGMIDAIGHRVVHGGEQFTQSAIIDESVLAAIEACNPLAPLHNPANALGIRTALQCFPGIPQVAVFDTAFHQSLAPEAYLYPLPYEYYQQHRIRRYGFHGTSHAYLLHTAASSLNRPSDALSLITLHLGNGCSAAAIEAGRCVDTTMGLTPLEGLMMGTRAGDIDAGVIFHLHRQLGLSMAEIDTLLNTQSGLLGISGVSNDMRELRAEAAQGNAAASLAITLFIRRLAKTIGALRTTLSTLDAIVFSGGIGAFDRATRSETSAQLTHLGVHLDPTLNATAGCDHHGIISPPQSRPAVLALPTHEELMIARETEKTVTATHS